MAHRPTEPSTVAHKKPRNQLITKSPPQQQTTPPHTHTYTHILKALHQHTTVTTPSTSVSPPLPKTSLPPTIPHQPSTSTRKPITTSSNHTISPSEHLPFTFYFIPNRPNYISKLNLPTNLAKLCTDIQRNAKLPTTKLVENYLSKQHKQKKRNKNKNNTSSTAGINYKLRFTPKEYKPTSTIPTSPIHTSPPTYTITATQTTPPGFDQHIPITTTQYTQPPQKSRASTTTTLYTKPTRKSHIFTCNKRQSLPQYTTNFHSQPNTHHASKLTYTRTTNKLSFTQTQITPTHSPYGNPWTTPYTTSINP